MSALSQDPDHPDVWLVPDTWERGRVVHSPTLLRGVHLEAECRGVTCTVHSPSRHHMRTWPLVWDDHTKVFRRVCVHGVAHPDPDTWGNRTHEGPCDGCCERGT